MKRQICIGFVLTATLVVLGMRSSQAQVSQYTEDRVVTGANTTSPASAAWFFDTVDDSSYDVGQHVSMALDLENGNPYVSYYDADHKSLNMAKYVGSGGSCGSNNDWECEIVDDTSNVGQYSSIAVDPTDNLPMISYYDADNHALKLAIGISSGWKIVTIYDPLIGSAGLYTSLKFDSNGKMHIAHYFSNSMGVDSVRYVKYVGGGTGNCGGNDYQCDIIDSGDQVGKYASLALDSSNQPRVAYYDGGNDALMYAYLDGYWKIREILPAESGKYASLYVDTDNGDLAHIAYYDSSEGKLSYAVYVGSGGNCGFDSSSTKFLWQCDAIDDIGTGSTDPWGMQLAVDQAGYPVIAYQSGGSVLKVARPVSALDLLVGDCGPQNLFYTWQCDGISYGISIGQGDYLSLAVNSSGLGTIAYYGNVADSNGDLVVAYQRLLTFLPLSMKE